jgi:hypothetical protein
MTGCYSQFVLTISDKEKNRRLNCGGRKTSLVLLNEIFEPKVISETFGRIKWNHDDQRKVKR